MQQLELFADLAVSRPDAKPLSLFWDEAVGAHVYRDADDSAWRGMSTCLFSKQRGYPNGCQLCRPQDGDLNNDEVIVWHK